MHTFKADALSWEGGGELIAVGTSDGIEVRPQQLGHLNALLHLWLNRLQHLHQACTYKCASLPSPGGWRSMPGLALGKLKEPKVHAMHCHAHNG